MQINNINLSEYGAKVQKKTFTDNTTIKNMEWSPNGTTPLLSSTVKGFKQLDIEILFEASNRNDINNNISKFMAQVTECIIKFKNLDHMYQCYYTTSSRVESGIDEWLFMTITFMCFEYDNEKSFSTAAQDVFTINNLGTDVTPVIIEVTPTLNMGDLQIEGFTEYPIILKSLVQNKTIVIDGEKQLVTMDSVNAFNNYDAWEYPVLKSGANAIKLSKKNLTINVIYKERFV